MAEATGKIKNTSGEARTLGGPAGRFVPKGAVIEVPLDEVYLYTQQDIWEPVGPDAKDAHEAGEAAYQERLAAENAPEEAAIEPELEEPAGNASRDEWAAYLIDNGLATEDDLAGLGRDEIRDTYKQEV